MTNDEPSALTSQLLLISSIVLDWKLDEFICCVNIAKAVAPVLDSSAYLQHGEQLKHVGRIARAAKKFQDEVREPMEALQRGGRIVQ